MQKKIKQLPLHLCDMQPQLEDNDIADLQAAELLRMARNYHDAGRHNGLHLVERGAPDPHLEGFASLATPRSRFGHAMDVMLGRADVRPVRLHPKQSWRA